MLEYVLYPGHLYLYIVIYWLFYAFLHSFHSFPFCIDCESLNRYTCMACAMKGFLGLSNTKSSQSQSQNSSRKTADDVKCEKNKKVYSMQMRNEPQMHDECTSHLERLHCRCPLSRFRVENHLCVVHVHQYQYITDA
jgi:hypothetical protein